jgi:hypothetical protein
LAAFEAPYFYWTHTIPPTSTNGAAGPIYLYERGTVKDGIYAGSRVVKMVSPDAFAQEPGGGMIVNSDFLLSADGKYLMGIGSLVFAPLQVPATLFYRGRPLYLADTANASQKTCTPSTCANIFTKESWGVGVNEFLPYAITDEGVSLYGGELPGDLVAFTKDGGAQTYHSIPSDINKIVWDTKIFSGITPPNPADYENIVYSGCGWNRGLSLYNEEDLGGKSALKSIGTLNGAAIYALKDPSTNGRVKYLYDMWMGYDETGSKPSMSSFLEGMPVPIFFWQDAFGRYLAYIPVGIRPAAECGKHVIYLYPEKTQQVSVRLPSFITVKKSEPTYPINGWNVTATPKGDLTMKDGSVYGSLYWDGVGASYDRPTEGFVVKDSDISSFLDKTLPQLGLQGREIREFKDFWLTQLIGSPYYDIRFLMTPIWSKAVPLSVVPAPNTSIRFFMDWRPLSAPISIKAPILKAPERIGFTLVEWGGTVWAKK